ncbi:hypothetical protein [Persicirhabdus sediminis]|uniref:Uncharacterized protein n=1 Tax=Persicirhabdus sediminis TaxID=454144 RepID=A0A8J7SL82_9BACT|nr:hypothetical protein [Persicirhabdus sediminis]MBK1790218.1 hypothetical protein [Persicirhabdus sediminis]
MASKAEIAQRKQALTAEISKARAQMTLQGGRLRKEFNLKNQVSKSISKQPSKWFAGSLAAGLGATFLFRKPKKQKVKLVAPPKPLSHLIIGSLMQMAKPAIQALVVSKLKEFAMERAQQSRR